MNVYNCDVPVIIMAQVEAEDEKQAKRAAEDIVYRFLNVAVAETEFPPNPDNYYCSVLCGYRHSCPYRPISSEQKGDTSEIY